MRLKAALADLQPGLQNQTALDIIFKLCFVKNFCLNDEGNCYKENRMLNVLGEFANRAIGVMPLNLCFGPFTCASITNAQE